MNGRRLCCLALAAALTLPVPGAQPRHADAQASRQQGMAYATWWSGQYSRPDADLALANLAATGADWISLIVTQYQDNIASTTIYSSTATPTDADLIHVIAQAHSLGLKVLLKPHVDLANDPAHWRGQIGQGFGEAEWATWFTSYQSFINHYAQLAQTYGADQFCVGTELSATTPREANWRSVIASVRVSYSGPITYAANHSGEETSITWWDAVDTIGVDAYYPLTNENNPTLAELKAAWAPHLVTLSDLASKWDKPILFTEIGYRSQDGANKHPWDWQVGGTVDLNEQADTYQATFESVFNQTWFAGAFWWSWGTEPFEGGPCDDGYTPHDKPAEDVLRAWYGAPPRQTGRTAPLADYSRTFSIYTDSLGAGWEDWSWSSAVDLSSTSPVYSGTRAISVTTQAWGALSLHHDNFDSSPYYWLEFYLRQSSADQQFRAFANDEHDTELRYLPLCRYAEGQSIEPGVWKRVRIPLTDLDASGRLLQRVSLKNYSDQPATLWIDEVRLVGGTWRMYLPLLLKN